MLAEYDCICTVRVFSFSKGFVSQFDPSLFVCWDAPTFWCRRVEIFVSEEIHEQTRRATHDDDDLETDPIERERENERARQVFIY